MLKTKKLEASQIAALAEVLPGSKLTAYIGVLQSMGVGFDVLHETEEGKRVGTYVVMISETERGQRHSVIVTAGYTSEFIFNDTDGEVQHVHIGVQQTFEDTDD